MPSSQARCSIKTVELEPASPCNLKMLQAEKQGQWSMWPAGDTPGDHFKSLRGSKPHLWPAAESGESVHLDMAGLPRVHYRAKSLFWKPDTAQRNDLDLYESAHALASRVLQ